MPIDFRPVGLVTGVGLVVLALAMVLPALVDYSHNDPNWRVFFASGFVMLVLGSVLVAAYHTGRKTWDTRQIFLLTVIGWVAVTLAAAIPFAAADLKLSLADAVFEAASGVTATGSTVLRHLDTVPPGILMWRALLQWLGGAGFLVVAVVVLPALNIGGMEIYRVETSASGPRAMPRSAKVAVTALAIYAVFTLLLTVLLMGAGMSRFPAMLHAMGSISCGGFSTADSSIGAWRNPAVDWVVLLGMLLGGAPFIVYVNLVRRRWREALSNGQLGWYLGMLLTATLVLAVWLLFAKGVKPLPAIRHGAFAVASVMTGTGYATLDYGNWGGLPVTILFFLSFMGGCAGSAAGGLKIFRVQILLTSVHYMVVRLLRPSLVLQSEVEGKVVTEPLAESVLGYLFIFVASFAVLALLLALQGLDFMSAISVSISSLANLGPGLTQAVGPMAGYADLPEAAKWLLSGAMVYGRLEMLMVLVLLTPEFWSR